MDINAMTIAEAKEVVRVLGKGEETDNGAGPYERLLGQNVVIRTVTYHYIGRLVGVSKTELLLEEAAWLALSGRWTQALETGDVSEAEPYPGDGECIVGRLAVVDCSRWAHGLVRSVR